MIVAYIRTYADEYNLASGYHWASICHLHEIGWGQLPGEEAWIVPGTIDHNGNALPFVCPPVFSITV